MPTEDWELSSGLREELIFDIHLAMFGNRANYNNGASMLLILTGTDENNEVFEHILSIGGDWFTPDQRHITHPSGKTKINKSSRYGQWITACMQIPTLWTYLQNSVGPSDAAVWENLRLHLKAVTKTTTIRGETSTRDVLEPVEFLGFLPTETQPQPQVPVNPMMQPVMQQPLQVPTQPVMTASPPSAPVAPPVGPTPEQMLAAAQQQAGLTPQPESPIRSQLREMARMAADHGTFVGQAFAVQGVVTDTVLVAELMDPNNFYAKARV